MPWWQQLAYGYVAATAAFNYMYWLLWRPSLTQTWYCKPTNNR